MPPVPHEGPNLKGRQHNSDGGLQRQQEPQYTSIPKEFLTNVPSVMPIGLPISQQQTSSLFFQSRSSSHEQLARSVSPLPINFGLPEHSSSYNSHLSNLQSENVVQGALQRRNADFDIKQQRTGGGSNDQSSTSLTGESTIAPQLNSVVNQIDTKSSLFMQTNRPAYYDNQPNQIPQQSQAQNLSSRLSPGLLPNETNIQSRENTDQSRTQGHVNTQAQVRTQSQAQAQSRTYQQQISHNSMFDRADSVTSAPMAYSSEQQPYLTIPYSQERYQQSPLPRPLHVPSSPVYSDELTSAVKAGNIDRVANLIHTGASVDGKDTKGWTAMHWAAATGNVDCVVLLCRAGADIQSKSYSSKTAMDLAKLRGHYTIVEILSACEYSSKLQQPNQKVESPSVPQNWNIDFNGIIHPVDGIGNENTLLHTTRNASVPSNYNLNHMDMSEGLNSNEGLGSLGDGLGGGAVDGSYSNDHAMAAQQYSLHLVDNPKEKRPSASTYDLVGQASGGDSFDAMQRSMSLNPYHDSDVEIRNATQLQQSLMNGGGKVEWSSPTGGSLAPAGKVKRRRNGSFKTSVSTGCIEDAPNASLKTSNFSASHLGDSAALKDSRLSGFFGGDGVENNSPSTVSTGDRREQTSLFGTDGCSCVECGTRNTPQWRKGPSGPRTLCNACGLKHLHSQQRERMNARRRELYMKSKKKKEEMARQAALEMAQYGDTAGHKHDPNDVSSGSQGNV
ncbi:hypothetical protein SARC_01358 [Sphaeroforma arctica JP610]|uniref:GATA-type domain-containing protein n=1 Tax=Sphaeroforma arctica JP610 TaxID=667725 RepID=A0A0L0GBU8_9EUKA|nr:hypothetical protein SARC_01358 [Sphaeroforma arctica JP610]KNC86487.1 hypothetical protein SARC_01358 [Sphaeroforma arctica JP610]|eukprot:XP_014160389.1 hypothetical protein SARC_01358 [Sphaeroforma arctica JP610]